MSVILKKEKIRFYCGRDSILIKTASIIAPLQTEMVYGRCSLILLDVVTKLWCHSPEYSKLQFFVS